jgi:hypothetical protein
VCAFVVVCEPRKALLDLIYLQPGGDSMAYLHALRLQNTDQLDVELLKKQSQKFGTPKMLNAAKQILRIISTETNQYEDMQ